MTVNKATLNLIKEFEGCKLTAYKDPVGIWTIGYGHTSAAGQPKVLEGMKITQAEADAILLRDLVKYENAVKKYVKVPLNDNQYGALTSFVYNVGEGNFSGSTLLRKLNSRDYLGASKQFGRWNKAGGKVLNGLTRRREAERVLFITGGTIPAKKAIQTVPAIPGTSKPPVIKSPSTSFLEVLMAILSKLFGGK